MAYDYGQTKKPAPTFAEAQNLRQRARAAGLDPNYWYAVALSSELPRGTVREFSFWQRSFALFRGQDGALRCVENRCAHRNLKLSLGTVEGCTLRCAYHGCAYDGTGCLVDMPHNDFGKKLKVSLASFPVEERYGLVWVFPGDPELSRTREIPRIPEIEGASRWAHDVIDFVWHGHGDVRSLYVLALVAPEFRRGRSAALCELARCATERRLGCRMARQQCRLQRRVRARVSDQLQRASRSAANTTHPRRLGAMTGAATSCFGDPPRTATPWSRPASKAIPWCR